MHRLCLVLAASSLLATSAAADEAGRALVEKAIKAHGGAEKVAKLRTMRIKVEGTMALAPNGVNN